jgi:hypothetical protein
MAGLKEKLTLKFYWEENEGPDARQSGPRTLFLFSSLISSLASTPENQGLK